MKKEIGIAVAMLVMVGALVLGDPTVKDPVSLVKAVLKRAEKIFHDVSTIDDALPDMQQSGVVKDTEKAATGVLLKTAEDMLDKVRALAKQQGMKVSGVTDDIQELIIETKSIIQHIKDLRLLLEISDNVDWDAVIETSKKALKVASRIIEIVGAIGIAFGI